MKFILIFFFLIVSFSTFCFSSSGTVNLYCKGQKLPISTNLNQVKMSFPVLETGTNALAFDRDQHEMIRFSFENMSSSYYGGQKPIYTTSFDRVNYLNDFVLGYELSGYVDNRGDADYNIKKLYEIHSFEQAIEAYHQDSNDISVVEIVEDSNGRYNFKMMLDGEVYGNFSGEYAVNCFIGTYK